MKSHRPSLCFSLNSIVLVNVGLNGDTVELGLVILPSAGLLSDSSLTLGLFPDKVNNNALIAKSNFVASFIAHISAPVDESHT